MLDKVLTYRSDAYIPDLEDAVPTAEKGEVRQVIAQYLNRLSAAGVPAIPRVNTLETGLAESDLAAVVGPQIAGVSIGKVYTPDDIHQVSAIISRLERDVKRLQGGRRRFGDLT